MGQRTVSLITTVLNEEESIGPFLESLLGQTREPNEIIICDAGSTDDTRKVVEQYIADGLRARVLVAEGANRSRGRNLAIASAKGEIIAAIDAGCVANRDWLARLMAPFESTEPPDVVAGYYEPDTADMVEDAIAAATVPAAEEVDGKTFLPSSRSVAFRRSAWEQVGGYPEYIDCAEDTAFDLRLREAGFRFFFEPRARVRWRMKGDFLGLFKQYFGYARSDGELDHSFGHYTKVFAALLAVIALLMVGTWPPMTTPVLVMLNLLFVAYWLRYALRARGRGVEFWTAALAPAASLAVDLGNLTGYLAGWMRARPRPARLPEQRPLSIAQVTYTYQPVTGGADVYVSQLDEVIRSAGHRPRVYQRRAEVAVRGIRFVPNPWHGLPFEFWTQALALFRLCRELLAHDVVICHYPHYLLAVDLMALFGRRPLLVGISHGVFWDDAPGSFRSAVKLWIARLAFRRAHLYIANDTQFLRAMGVRINPGEGMHTQVAAGVWFVPNAVDPEEFRPAPGGSSEGDKGTILVPRNLFRNRGIHLAVAAFAEFVEDHPETALLVVGGGGRPAYVESLRRQIEQLGLQKRVVLYGPVPHDKLPAVYANAQLTLIPSLCGEGTSLSALESMASGTATICTYVAGLRDLPGPHALPTVTGLVEVMREVYPDRVRVGEEQRKAVLARYSIQVWRRGWQHASASAGLRLK